MFLGLRMMRGIDKTEFVQMFTENYDEIYGEVTEKLAHTGLLTDAGGRVKLTERGIDVSNKVLSEFLLPD